MLRRRDRAPDRPSGRHIDRRWQAAYIAVTFLLAVSTDDIVIRLLLTASAIGAGYSLGRKSQERERVSAR